MGPGQVPSFSPKNLASRKSPNCENPAPREGAAFPQDLTAFRPALPRTSRAACSDLCVATDWRAMRPTLTRTTQQILRNSPARLRAIARAAHVSHSTLARIVSGERDATPAVARALEHLFARWGRQYAVAARRLRAALRPPR